MYICIEYEYQLDMLFQCEFNENDENKFSLPGLNFFSTG